MQESPFVRRYKNKINKNPSQLFDKLNLYILVSKWTNGIPKKNATSRLCNIKP